MLNLVGPSYLKTSNLHTLFKYLLDKTLKRQSIIAQIVITYMIFRSNLKYLNKTELMCEEKVVESEA